MSKLINTTAMTVDGLTDVGDWFVTEGDYDRASLASWDHQRLRRGGPLADRGRARRRAAVLGPPGDRRRGDAPYEGMTGGLKLLGSASYDPGVTLLRYQPQVG